MSMTLKSQKRGRSSIILGLSAFVLLPSFIYVTSELTSLSAPLALICCGLLVPLALRKRSAYPKAKVQFFPFTVKLLLFLLGLHLAIDLVVNPVFEAIATFVTLAIFSLTAYLAVPLILKLTPGTVLSSVTLIFIAVSVSLILSIFSRPLFLNYENFPSAVFPFAEPSHFAVFTAPLFLISTLVASRTVAILISLALLVASVNLPNVTLGLIALTTLCAVILRGVRRDLFIVCFVSGAFALAYFFDSLVGLLPEYHQARAGLSIDNLTSLVYLQGYERAYSGTINTLGYGAGFMRLEEVPPGFYGNRIFEIIGSNKNIRDGAFIFARFVAEFGILGLLISLLFAGYSFFILLDILKYSKNFSNIDWANKCTIQEQMFFYKFVSGIFIFSYSFEFFVRGVGYVSSGTFFLFLGIFMRLWLKKANAHRLVKSSTAIATSG